jgi:methyl-accepting chemotaxis protein
MIDQQLAAVANTSAPSPRWRRPACSREDARSKLGATADNAVAQVPKSRNRCCRATACAIQQRDRTEQTDQQARFQVRGYTYSGKTEQPALDAIDNALKNLEPAGQLPEQHIANLQQAADSLKAYRAAVSQFRDSQVSVPRGNAWRLRATSCSTSARNSPNRKPWCATPMPPTPRTC